MKHDTEHDQVLNETLRKIGRNVVNFQKMEAMLKHLLAHSNVQGCVSNLTEVLGTRVASYAKQPMGKLANAFVKSTCFSSVKTVEGPEDLAEPWVSMLSQAAYFGASNSRPHRLVCLSGAVALSAAVAGDFTASCRWRALEYFGHLTQRVPRR